VCRPGKIGPMTASSMGIEASLVRSTPHACPVPRSAIHSPDVHEHALATSPQFERRSSRSQRASASAEFDKVAPAQRGTSASRIVVKPKSGPPDEVHNSTRRAEILGQDVSSDCVL
jgi:hypothetical protein